MLFIILLLGMNKNDSTKVQYTKQKIWEITYA